MPGILSELLRTPPCSLSENAPLAPLTTFRVGGPAKLLAEPRSESELVELLRRIVKANLPFFYIGLGSNLLVSDAGFGGIVIRARGELAKFSVSETSVVAGPGARLILLASSAARNGLSGMEKISGIPGTVGGGLWMNAGAYGGEICDVFEEVNVITPDIRLERLTKNDISFGYRSAPELREMIVLSSRYRFARSDAAAVLSEMRRVWTLRREKQPVEFPSAGSIFKRPPNDFAGRLIEEAGCKGLRVGGAVVPAKHAGIFINDCNATATHIATLIRTVRQRVFDKFKVELETEILPVGFESDPFEIQK